MPGRTRSRTLSSNPEEARKHLLDTAEACFERFGITKTSMDDIADAAKVSRPTLYRYFGDRDSLIRTIVETRATRLVGHAHKYLNRQEALEDKLVKGLVFLAEHGRQDEFVHLLLQPETLSLANQLLMGDDSLSVAFAEAVWQPVLQAAREDGSLSPTVDLGMAYQWLTWVNYMLIGWIEVDGGVQKRHERIVRDFVTPAFLAPARAR